MIGALWNGMTGIYAFDKAISVEANNSSNANTAGHKLDDITFEDMIYKSGYGKGVGTQSVDKVFTQGNITLTNTNLDAAIEGTGFFVVEDRISGEKYYTRGGSFEQASDGLLATQDGMKVMGLIPQSRNIISSDANDTSFTNDFSRNITTIDIGNNSVLYNINVRTTDFYSSATDDLTSLSGSNYKTASSKIIDVELLRNDYIEKLKLLRTNPDENSVASTTQITQVDLSAALSELTNESDFVSVRINNSLVRVNFDTDIETTLRNLSDEISNTQGLSSSIDATTGILTIEGLVPGKEFTILEANVNNDIANITKIQDATLGSGLAMVESSREAFKNAVEKADGKFLEITNVLNYGNTNVIGESEINLRLNAQGLVPDAKVNVSISNDGYVYVSYDGNEFLVGKISTASFRNPQGLDASGGNNYKVTKESGLPFNADSLNTVISNSLENANINYGSTLSSLLVYQKAFEANSKSITVSDEFLKTAMDMIK